MKFLTELELKKLADVIGELEEKTAGEIRLMIVRRSAVTGHVHNTLWMLLLSITFLWIWFERHDVIYFERWWMWPGLVVGYYLLSGILARFEFVQRAFTANHDLHHQVWARAEVEFHREGLAGTKAHTGVLIFLSLMERYAVVLADKGIADKVPVHGWDKVVSKVVSGARTGRWAEKLEDALRECGAYLASHFPPQPGKGNELPNTVIIKD